MSTNQANASPDQKGAAGPKPQRRIAVFIQCTNLGGMENVAYGLYDLLRARGFELRIVTPRQWGAGQERVQAVDAGAQAFDYRGKFGWRSFIRFNRRAQTACQGSPVVWVMGTCVSCLVAARISGRRALLSHHYHHFEGRWSWIRWKLFYLAFGRGLDRITYPTEFTRAEAVKIAPWIAAKTRVVRNTFTVNYSSDADRLDKKQKARARLGIPQDAFVVGNAGWLIQRKRFDVFLQTAGLIAARLPSARFYICGGGPLAASLQQMAAGLGMADRVHFQGWVRDMPLYYQAWDVLLFNSDFDAFGCAPLEAASHGCPCVASLQYGGLSEFIRHGETGFLLPAHDPQKLADLVCQLATGPELAARIRQQAAALLVREFSDEAALRFYEDYFSAAAGASDD